MVIRFPLEGAVAQAKRKESSSLGSILYTGNFVETERYFQYTAHIAQAIAAELNSSNSP